MSSRTKQASIRQWLAINNRYNKLNVRQKTNKQTKPKHQYERKENFIRIYDIDDKHIILKKIIHSIKKN